METQTTDLGQFYDEKVRCEALSGDDIKPELNKSTNIVEKYGPSEKKVEQKVGD